MVKNIKRYKREQDKERETKERASLQFNLDFVPVTFVLGKKMCALILTLSSAFNVKTA